MYFEISVTFVFDISTCPLWFGYYASYILPSIMITSRGEEGAGRGACRLLNRQRFEPCHEKSCLRDLRPDKTQTGLLS